MATLAEMGEFDQIIDVRSPAEFADDHLPGAINLPVLDNDERARVGTIYTQDSPFAARKIGAALVARNIARHLDGTLSGHDKRWRPLVYCWRGGQRSGAMVTILRAIGWNAAQMEGGYKRYRRHVLDQLDALPGRFAFRVICGPTGSAKTRLLQRLAERGEQVLDLETWASHKGSVLGALPDTPQPSQKAFESTLVEHLARLDPDRPVYVEAESRKIGQLRLPDALLIRMRGSRCYQIEAPVAARVDFLLADYSYMLTRPDWLKSRLLGLADLHSRETLARWLELIDQACWPELVGELLEQHYDPHYRRSQARHFQDYSLPVPLIAETLSPATLDRLANAISASGCTGSDSCA